MSVLKFLGATVLNYNSNVGYNNQESTLDLSLVEDIRDGDTFYLSNYMTREGHPTYFEHGAFFFGGIIRNWSKSNSSQGITYSVSLSDPRIFFEGITLLINNYNNTVSTPNIINIYGHLEQNFGKSNKNEAGIQASLILNTLRNMSGSPYNGGISFYGINYFIDISGIPTPPTEFRLSQNIISFADFLNEIAEVTSSTYTSYLYLGTLGWTIAFAFSSRSAAPSRGIIGNYINQLTDPSVKNNGIELVNEVTTKFLFGGNKTDIYIQNYKDGYNDGRRPEQLNIDRRNDTSIDNPIFGYYGKDLDGNLAIPVSNFRNFPIDARNVNITGLGDIYYSNDDELRAAISGIDIWKGFLVSQWPYEYIPDEDGNEVDFAYKSVSTTRQSKANKKAQINKNVTRVAPTVTTYEVVKGTFKYKHSGIKNPHFKKAFNLKMDSDIDIGFLDSINDAGQNFGFPPNILESYMNKNSEAELFEKPVEALYTLISNFANENHGKKFTVKIPEIQLAVEPDTNLRRYNVVPSDGGYLDSSSFAGGVANNLIPKDVTALTLDDNRLSCYVRFDDIGELNLTEIGAENIVFNNDKTRAFVRCDIDPEFVFTDYKNAIGARALITLPGKVFKITDEENGFLLFMQERILNGQYSVKRDDLELAIDDMTEDEVIEFITTRYSIGKNTKVILTLDAFSNPEIKTSINIEKRKGLIILKCMAKRMLRQEEVILKERTSKISADMSINGSFAPKFVHPNMAAIPLLSNVSFYGPWISSIGTGKTDVEYDPELVPWNFNGFDILNTIANARVNEISGNLTWSETGSIEIPGVPICSLGQQLVSSGPYVSDISVSIGVDGFMTSYKMSSWTPRFNKISNTMTDKLSRVTRTAQAESRNMIEKFRIQKRSK